jgi:hypothetical protein
MLVSNSLYITLSILEFYLKNPSPRRCVFIDNPVSKTEMLLIIDIPSWYNFLDSHFPFCPIHSLSSALIIYNPIATPPRTAAPLQKRLLRANCALAPAVLVVDAAVPVAVPVVVPVTVPVAADEAVADAVPVADARLARADAVVNDAVRPVAFLQVDGMEVETPLTKLTAAHYWENTVSLRIYG